MHSVLPVTMATSIAATHRFADWASSISEDATKETARLLRLSNDRVRVRPNLILKRDTLGPNSMLEAEALRNFPLGQRTLNAGS